MKIKILASASRDLIEGYLDSQLEHFASEQKRLTNHFPFR